MNVMLVGYIISDFVLYILAYRVVLHARVNAQKILWILAICMLTLIHAVIYRIYGERWTTNLTLFFISDNVIATAVTANCGITMIGPTPINGKCSFLSTLFFTF